MYSAILKVLKTNGKRKDDGAFFFGAQSDISDGEDVYPIVDGKLVNFEAFEALLKHTLLNELGLMESFADVCLLLVIPMTRWGVLIQAEILKICFEKLGLAGVYLGETALLAALGCAQASALVIDFGHEGTDVSVVWDGHALTAFMERYPIGSRDVDNYIMERLKDSEISDSASLQMAKSLKETGHLVDGKISFSHNGTTMFSNEIDIIEKAKHIYFNQIDDQFGLHHFILSLLSRVDADKRAALLDSLIITGLGSQLWGLPDAMLSAITSILPASGYAADHQSSRVTLRHVPEYYPEVWQKAGPVAAWFGAGITSKMVWPDSKAHYTKEEYSQLGPTLLLHQKPL